MGNRDSSAPEDVVANVADAVAGTIKDAGSEVAAAADDFVDRVAGVSTDDGTVWRESASGAEFVIDEHGAGAPLFLLVHGIGMGRKVFADLIVHLRQHGRVWALDQPGYGEASEPPRTPTMQRSADLIAEILRRRGEHNVIAIGHSMGTQVVTELAVRHPDLVSRIVLAAPTVDVSARKALRQLLRLIVDLLDDSPKVLLLGAREYLRAGPNLPRKMRAMLVHRPEESYPRVTVPALVMRGEDDKVVPHAWAEQVVRLIPNARLVELAGRGHETLIKDAKDPAGEILSFASDR